METICSPGCKKEKTLRECIESLECLFKAYQKDSEFNYQLSVDDSPFNILKRAVLEQERSMSSSLKDAFDEVCFECGHGDEYVIDYVKAHDNEPKALLEEAKQLNEVRKEALIDILLSSEYDVFVPWYKALLLYCIDLKEEACVQWRAKDIFTYYKKGFDKVENLE